MTDELAEVLFDSNVTRHNHLEESREIKKLEITSADLRATEQLDKANMEAALHEGQTQYEAHLAKSTARVTQLKGQLTVKSGELQRSALQKAQQKLTETSNRQEMLEATVQQQVQRCQQDLNARELEYYLLKRQLEEERQRHRELEATLRTEKGDIEVELSAARSTRTRLETELSKENLELEKCKSELCDSKGLINSSREQIANLAIALVNSSERTKQLEAEKRLHTAIVSSMRIALFSSAQRTARASSSTRHTQRQWEAEDRELLVHILTEEKLQLNAQLQSLRETMLTMELQTAATLEYHTGLERSLRDELHNLRSVVAEGESEMGRLRTREKQLVEQEEAARQDFNLKKGELNSQLWTLRKAVQAKEQSRFASTSEGSLAQEVQTLRRKLQKTYEEKHGLEVEVNKLTQAAAAFEEEVRHLQQSHENLVQEARDLKEQTCSARELTDQLFSTIQTLEGSVREAEQQRSREREEKQEALSSRDSTISLLRAKIEELQAQLSTFQEAHLLTKRKCETKQTELILQDEKSILDDEVRLEDHNLQSNQHEAHTPLTQLHSEQEGQEPYQNIKMETSGSAMNQISVMEKEQPSHIQSKILSSDDAGRVLTIPEQQQQCIAKFHGQQFAQEGGNTSFPGEECILHQTSQPVHGSPAPELSSSNSSAGECNDSTALRAKQCLKRKCHVLLNRLPDELLDMPVINIYRI